MALDLMKNVGEKIGDIKKFYNERESDKKLWRDGERWVIAMKFGLVLFDLFVIFDSHNISFHAMTMSLLVL